MRSEALWEGILQTLAAFLFLLLFGSWYEWFYPAAHSHRDELFSIGPKQWSHLILDCTLKSGAYVHFGHLGHVIMVAKINTLLQSNLQIECNPYKNLMAFSHINRQVSPLPFIWKPCVVKSTLNKKNRTQFKSLILTDSKLYYKPYINRIELRVQRKAVNR